MPRMSDFKNLYALFNSGLYGGKNGEFLLIKLEEKIKEYNESNGKDEGKIVHKVQTDEKSAFVSLIIVIVTPLMARVHKSVQHSGELVFVDSTSNLDEHNLRFFMLCTHSVAGGLPLGIILMSDEKEDTQKEALRMFKECLPSCAFYNRGITLGLQVFLTDNNFEERSALTSSWPNASLLLCVFHLLQAVWRWLVDKENNISKDDRTLLVCKVKELVYAETENEVQDKHHCFMHSGAVLRHPNFAEYFMKFVWPN